MLACHFDAMDALHEKNGFVDSDEWLHYFLDYRNNKSISKMQSGYITSGYSEPLKLQAPFQYKQHIHHRASASKFHHSHKNSIRRKDKQNDRMR